MLKLDFSAGNCFCSPSTVFELKRLIHAVPIA